ncbi:type III secretion system FlhB-like substrate exporter [Pseudomonas nitritireducens]|uniref:Type III secretion system FlhB-like substrate exporter n=1 Tax=Pseudomonas nitroreducens TaxID=46680 RepID=A0A7W7KN57_PSENT|nr:hypothetical protein [Pseudomonas nitritireducens]MBB4865404.1 type III secretion system FlhB-like substrate exporter [Pseudomonas nitritireducens]
MNVVPPADQILRDILTQARQESAGPQPSPKAFPATLENSLKGTPGGGARPGPGYAPLQDVPLTQSSPSTILALNKASVAISELLGAFPQYRRPEVSIPYLQVNGGDVVGQIAQSIKLAVQTSGLFYESHVLQYLQGRYSFNQLMLEPQARAVVTEGAVGKWLRELAGAGPRDDPRLLQLMRTQLAMLSDPSILLRGELFPGYPVEIRIRREAKAGDSYKDQQSWRLIAEVVAGKAGECSFDLIMAPGVLKVWLRSKSSLLVEFFRRDRVEVGRELRSITLLPEIVLNRTIASNTFVSLDDNPTDGDAPYRPAGGTGPYGLHWDELLAQMGSTDLPAHARPELIPFLANLDLDRHIPTSLYGAAVYLVGWARSQQPYL